MQAFLFPGQGSQYVGMGEGLWERYPERVSRANEMLGYSVQRLCLEDPGGMLDETEFTQPALFVTSVLHYHDRLDNGFTPDVCAGHSLGEYTALYAAGVLDYETALNLVQKRGEIMGNVEGGGMAAVLGTDADRIREILHTHGFDELDVANDNAPGEVVISGTEAQIHAAKDVFEEIDACDAYVPLRVSGAFHSWMMESARKEFADVLDSVSFDAPSVPVYSNVEARPHEPGRIRPALERQLTYPVRWHETVRHLLGRGVKSYVEVGPGDTLTDLFDRVRSESTPLTDLPPSTFGGDTSQADAAPSASASTSISLSSTPSSPESTPNGRRSAGSASDPVESAPNSTRDEAAGDPHTASTANPPSQRSANGEDSSRRQNWTAATLGNPAFRQAHGVQYAYMSGSMYKGIASKELVVTMAKAGFLSSLGTGGMDVDRIEDNLRYIQSHLDDEPFAANLLCNLQNPDLEERTVDIYLKLGIDLVEASAYMQITPSLVRYRLSGLHRDAAGRVQAPNRIIAKVSRPEVAEAFMRPAPQRIVDRLRNSGKITDEEAQLSQEIPVARDVTVEADSGGHTDKGNAYTLVPTMLRLRDDVMREENYDEKIRVGTAGGIGTPQAAAAAFTLGADYIVTGSINQCTVESGMSDAAKDMLESIDVHDTTYAPAGDMFETGAQVQVLDRGVFFPVRANKLYDLYKRYDKIEDIPAGERERIQNQYFQRSFEDVWAETREHYAETQPEVLKKAQQSPKQKMALIFRWYFVHSTRLALQGREEKQVDFQVHTGPSLGAFNRWVADTRLESWKQRHVDDIGRRLLDATAETLTQRYGDRATRAPASVPVPEAR